MHSPFYNRYAIRESNSIVKIFKNFKEKKSFKPDFGAEGNVNIVLWKTSEFGGEKFPLYCSLDVFLFCRNLWRFLAWGEVSEWPGVL